MTYLTFHLLFLVPPIAVLAVAAARIEAVRRRDLGIVALLCAIALVYTTPWDNYLVYRGVWSYGAGRVVGTIGYVPIEEYLFFVLQPLLTGLWLLVVLARRRVPGTAARRTADSAARTARRLGASAGLVVTAAGAACLARESTLYLGLILAWAGPVVAGQWFLAGERFLNRAYAIGVAAPTIYLWAADRFAIGRGIWSISPRYTTGWEPMGLPVEEAVFFLVTNVLVIQGILMFRPLRESGRSPRAPAETSARPAS